MTVTLTGTTGDGTPVNQTTTTGSDGSYSFTNLKPGTYTVTFTKTNGHSLHGPRQWY
ncbi:MAG: carboxypeptidase regulatory-like domain-containing protein [Saprospiraceae bacterium]|nr:carboxypeptidase regulatory-like domain-containing protein [Saprospiraceae bacterium]